MFSRFGEFLRILKHHVEKLYFYYQIPSKIHQKSVKIHQNSIKNQSWRSKSDVFRVFSSLNVQKSKLKPRNLILGAQKPDLGAKMEQTYFDFESLNGCCGLATPYKQSLTWFKLDSGRDYTRLRHPSNGMRRIEIAKRDRRIRGGQPIDMVRSTC